MEKSGEIVPVNKTIVRIRSAYQVVCYGVIGIVVSSLELVLILSILEFFLDTPPPFQAYKLDTALIVSWSLFTAASSVVHYYLGKLQVTGLSLLFPPETRLQSAPIFAASPLIIWLFILSRVIHNGAILAIAPIIFYFLGCYRGLKEVRASCSQNTGTLTIPPAALDDVLNSRSLVELNTNARAAVIALGKKCPDSEQAVTVLLDNLVKAKRMNDAEQISNLYLKFTGQQSLEEN